MPTPAARFDDLISGRSFRLVGPVSEIVASELHEVVPAVRAAERAAASGRWVAALVAYEAAPAFDPALTVHSGDPGVPAAWFGVFEGCSEVAPPDPVMVEGLVWEASVTRERHAELVERVRSLIAEGITYQVNLTHRLVAGCRRSPGTLYAAMLHAQRSAYGAELRFGDVAVLSASPELFFELDGERVVGRPMKGTIRRGRWSEEDRELAARLAASEKDRAENLMIVDLIRNDLGRVARFGTVAVDSLFDIEAYETVWQMTSTVSALRRDGVGLAELFAALFPCGSVTGAPKPSTMGVIAELEDSPRGPYCGAIGFLEPGGRRAVFSVAIRTAVMTNDAVVYGTGGGITWDSDPAEEWEETRSKAALLAAPRPPFDLLETLRVDEGGLRHLERHLDRMEASARYFRRPFDRRRVRDAVVGSARAGPPRRVRVVVDPAGQPAVEVTPIDPAAGSVRLAIDAVPIDREDAFRFHKTTHRVAYEAAALRHPEADDVVAVNDRGEVAETTIGNLLVRFGERWITPPLDAGCLPGIERAALVESGAVTEAVIPVDRLAAADEIEVVNSVRLRRPAVLC